MKIRIVASALVCSLAAGLVQAKTPPQANAATPIPPGVAAPDQMDTRLGTLKFFDGFPDDATVEKLYDNLDFQRAVQAYLLAIPAVNQAAMRKALLTWGRPTRPCRSGRTWSFPAPWA